MPAAARGWVQVALCGVDMGVPSVGSWPPPAASRATGVRALPLSSLLASAEVDLPQVQWDSEGECRRLRAGVVVYRGLSVTILLVNLKETPQDEALEAQTVLCFALGLLSSV